MKRKFKSKLWMSIAVIAVLAGITAAAVMAAQPAVSRSHARHRPDGEHGQSLLATAASYLASTPAQLKSKLQSGKSLAEIANATSGKSSHGLIEALEAAEQRKLAKVTASLSARISARVNRPGWDVGRKDRAMQVLSSYLGLSSTQLRTELRSGKTLAGIANTTSGKSEAGLIEALVSFVKSRLAMEVRAGSITQAQANERLPRLASRIASRVNRTERSVHVQAGARKHRRAARATG